MIEVKRAKGKRVTVAMNSGDYEILRMILADTALNANDNNIRDYLTSVMLPSFPVMRTA